MTSASPRWTCSCGRTLISLLLVAMACGEPSAVVPLAEVQSGTFEVTLSVPGSIAAVNETLILAPAFNGRPKIAWMAEQGQRVSKDERVLEFDRDELLKQLDTAESELELARTKILQNESKLELAVGEAQAGITKAELDLQLAQMRRTDSETVPLVEREESRIGETKSKMAIEAASSSLASVRLESRADTQLLQLEVEKRKRQVEELKEQIEHTIVLAPTDGVVLVMEKWDGFWTVGSSPWSGAELISLPDLAEMKVEAQVHEVDSPRIAVGQRARVVLDAFPDRLAEGEVKQVADLAVAKGDDEIKYLEIEVALIDSGPQMLPGLSTRVELVLDTVEDATWLPIEAVFRDDDADWVYVSGLTGWNKTAVTLGVENDTHVVVVDGVAAGSMVALVDPTTDKPRAAAEP